MKLLHQILTHFRSEMAEKHLLEQSKLDHNDAPKQKRSAGKQAIHVPAQLNQALYLISLINESSQMLDVFKYQDANCFLTHSNSKEIVDDHPVRMFEPLSKGES